VVPRDEYIDNGQATLAILDIDQSKQTGEDPYNTAPRRTFPAYQLTTGVLAYAVVPPSLVQSVGLDQLPGLLVGSTTRVPTTAEEDKVNEMLQGIRLYGSLERGAPIETPGELWILMIAAAIIAL